MLEVRPATPDDLHALPRIFYRGVHEGAAPRYSAAERQAWLPQEPDVETFAVRLNGQSILVAEADGAILGFMALTSDGYLDFAYVLPEARGSGVADALLAVLQNRAAANGLMRLTTRASHMARPFFARHGWDVVEPVSLVRDGVTIEATNMARALPV